MSTPSYSLWNRPPSIQVSHSSEELPLLHLAGDFGSARFSPQGAHLIDFTPKNGKPMLFTSRNSHFAPGKAIRGGIPVIFPWFGPKDPNPLSPMHGFVRTRIWEVDFITVPEVGPATVQFSLESNEETLRIWPHPFRLTLEFKLGSSLEIVWKVRNTGRGRFQFEQALHPYFPVADIHSASVHGLHGIDYVDKTDQMSMKIDSEPTIRFTAETDRLYPDTTSDCILEDPTSGRRLRIEKKGSSSSVVWNPWVAKAAALSDLGDEEWRSFVCVEQVNAGRNAITLPAGACHYFEARYNFLNK